jgi:hypothetical protein
MRNLWLPLPMKLSRPQVAPTKRNGPNLTNQDETESETARFVRTMSLNELWDQVTSAVAWRRHAQRQPSVLLLGSVSYARTRQLDTPGRRDAGTRVASHKLRRNVKTRSRLRNTLSLAAHHLRNPLTCAGLSGSRDPKLTTLTLARWWFRSCGFGQVAEVLSNPLNFQAVVQNGSR